MSECFMKADHLNNIFGFNFCPWCGVRISHGVVWCEGESKA